MAEQKNRGQFGNRADTSVQTGKSGMAGGGKFEKGSARAVKAGKAGARAQPTEAKRLGGRHSHQAM
jgi:hypothetical protein